MANISQSLKDYGNVENSKHRYVPITYWIRYKKARSKKFGRNFHML